MLIANLAFIEITFALVFISFSLNTKSLTNVDWQIFIVSLLYITCNILIVFTFMEFFVSYSFVKITLIESSMIIVFEVIMKSLIYILTILVSSSDFLIKIL